MCEWTERTLGDLVDDGRAELQTGPFGTMLHASAYRESGTPVVAVKHIGDNALIHDDLPRIGDDDVARLERYKLRRGDILFARKGSVSRRAIVGTEEEGWIQGSDCIRLRLDKGKINPAFVSYCFGTQAHVTWIEQHAHGATMPSLNQEILRLIPIELPSKKDQDRIAHILGTPDDKIELNRRMNRTLEAIARAIFKSWFIDFGPVIDNAILNGKPIPDEFAERAEARREILARSQPSPPAPLPEVEGRNYRGGFDFTGLVETARELRNKQAPAEEVMWELLRDRRFMGLKFRRQHQIGNYIADFYCHEHKLVIELDGGIHESQEAKDAKRDAYMKTLGLTVLRLSNDEVLNSPERVLLQFADAAGLSTSPSGRGEGEGVAGYRHLFPDSFQDSPLGKIPKGWEVTALGDVGMEISTGKRPKGGVKDLTEGVPSIGAENVLGLGRYDYGKTKYVPVEFFESMKSGVVDDRDVLLYKDGASLGRKSYFQDGFPYQECCVNEHVFLLRTGDPHGQRYLYFWLDQPWMTEEIVNLNSNSAQPGINRGGVESLPFLVPTDDVLNAYDALVSPLFGRLFANCLANRALEDSRDALLPKLLSGEIGTDVTGGPGGAL